jgi:hypothetical protein
MNGQRRLRVQLFIGPTISGAEVEAVCAACDAEIEILPPVQQGDILRLSNALPDVLGIVDGYFFQVPSVLHKEILYAIERGTYVLGAASLGALRAAELDTLGMEGFGQVYRWYKRGKIDGDDEVAVLHASAEDGFKPLTAPLVNLRYNLRRAQVRRLLSQRMAAAILRMAKQMHFTNRSYAAILHTAHANGIIGAEYDPLRHFFRHEAIDLKHEDALELLKTIVARSNGTRPWPVQDTVRVNQTVYLHLSQREYAGRTAVAQHLADTRVLAFQKLLDPSFPAFLRRIRQRCLVADEALHRELTSADATELIEGFQPWQRLRSDAQRQDWLQARCLSYEDLVATLRDRDHEARCIQFYLDTFPHLRSRAAASRKIVADVAARTGAVADDLLRLPLMQPGVPWEAPLLREMKVLGRFATAVKVAEAILDANRQYVTSLPGLAQSLSTSRLDRWFADSWGVTEPELGNALIARGFTSYSEFVEVARPAYIYQHIVGSG